MNFVEFCRFLDLFKKRGDLRGDPDLTKCGLGCYICRTKVADCEQL